MSDAEFLLEKFILIREANSVDVSAAPNAVILDTNNVDKIKVETSTPPSKVKDIDSQSKKTSHKK